TVGAPIFPATKLISQMTPNEIRSKYVLYIGAGAVATGGVVSFGRAMPTIVKAFRAGVKNLSTGKKGGAGEAVPRTRQDLSFKVVVFGSLALLAAMTPLPQREVSAIAS